MSDVARPEAVLAALDTATQQLIAAAAGLDAEELSAPSLLPGWTRGHVLAHLSRNADALVNVLNGRPMYSSGTARDADIEHGSDRSPQSQRQDLRESAARLRQVAGAFRGADWDRRVELRNGVTDRAGRVPFRRWVEVELHHIDLGVGRTVGDLPGAFTDQLLGYLTERFDGHPDLPALEIRAEDGRSWTTGAAAGVGGGQVVDGPATALAGWLSGRTSGSGLTTDGAALPALPPL